MEFKQLECFVKVVDKKSFSKAAKSLFISQPAVTSSIQKLELGLDIKLINRNGKDISLTEAGIELYSYAIELINLRSKAINAIGIHNHIENRVLTIHTSTIPARYILPELILKFKSEYKDFSTELKISDSRAVVDDILIGKINLGFVGSEYPNNLLNYIDFYEDELVLITSNDVEFDSDLPSFDELIKYDLILREDGSGTRAILEDEFKSSNLNINKFKSISENEDSQSIKKMVSLGYGISFVSKLDIQNELKLGLLKSYSVKDLNLKRNFKIVYAKYRHFSPIETAFKNYILNL